MFTMHIRGKWKNSKLGWCWWVVLPSNSDKKANLDADSFFFFNWRIVALQCFFFFFFFAVQQSESAIYYTHIPSFFWISFPFRSLQSIACSSLYCIIGSHQLSILYIVVYICQSQSPNFSHPSIPCWCSCFFSTSVSLFLLCKQIHLYHFFQISHICIHI